MAKKISKATIIKNKFEIKNIWTTVELFEELKGIFPDEEEKKLRHRIRSEINTLRQKGKVKRIAPTKWEKFV